MFINFIFFSYIILPILAGSVHLNNELFNEIIQTKDRPPIFIEVWDPHCHNCKSFKSDWETLTSLQYFHKKIIFADINCISEKKLCQKISPGKEFPRFVWFDTDKSKSISYTGSYALQDLALWLKSQLQNRIEVVNDTSQFEKQKQIALKISLFRFTISESDAKYLQILNEVVDSVKHLNIKIVLSYSNQQIYPIIEHFTPDNRIIKMRADFLYKNIVKFIKIHSVRFFVPYDDLVGMFSSAEKMPIMVFIYAHNNSQLRKTAINAAKAINDESIISISQLSCPYNPHFCRYYNIKDDNQKITVIIINKFRSFFWTFEYNDDVKSLQNWTLEALRYKIKPSGPGVAGNFLKPVLELYYELRAQGGWKYYFFFAPLIALIAFIITLAMYISTLGMDQNPSTNNSKDKKD